MNKKEKRETIQKIKEFFQSKMNPPISTWFYKKLNVRMQEEITKVKNK